VRGVEGSLFQCLDDDGFDGVIAYKARYPRSRFVVESLKTLRRETGCATCRR
jgi:hypothetical protein